MYIYVDFSIGWNHSVQQERLSIYQLITPETGPVFGLSLVIEPDYLWTISYRNEIVSIEHCSILQKMPSLIDTGKKTLGVYQVISVILVS